MRPVESQVAERLVKGELSGDDALVEWSLASAYGGLPEPPWNLLIKLGIPGLAVLALLTGLYWLALGSLVLIVWSFVWFFFLGRKPFLLALTQRRVLVMELSPDMQDAISTEAFSDSDLLPPVVARAALGPSTLHLRSTYGHHIMLAWNNEGDNGPRMDRLLEALQKRVGREN